MPSTQSTERIVGVKYADSQAVKGWHEKSRAQAMSALSLANNPEYAVFGVRNTKSLIGIIAVRDGNEIQLLHIAARDYGREVLGMLISAIINFAGAKRIKSPYPVPNWRKVGNEYWSK